MTTLSYPTNQAIITEPSTAQTISFTGVPTGGTFELIFKSSTTGTINYSSIATSLASNIQAALNALATVGTSGGTANSLVSAINAASVSVTFQGSLGGTSQPTMTDMAVTLTGGSSPKFAITGRALTLNLTDGALTSLTDVDGSMRTLAYNAYQQVVLDNWAPYVTTFGYDSTSGRLTSVNQGLGSVWSLIPAALPPLTTSPATHLSAANTATLTDPLGHVTAYTVDAHGREIAEIDANGATTTWLRNTAGEAIAQTDALGNNTFMVYANNGDLLQENTPDGSEEQYVYDGPFNELTLAVLTGPGDNDVINQYGNGAIYAPAQAPSIKSRSTSTTTTAT